MDLTFDRYLWQRIIKRDLLVDLNPCGWTRSAIWFCIVAIHWALQWWWCTWYGWQRMCVCNVLQNVASVLQCDATICDSNHSYWRTWGGWHRRIHVVCCRVLQCVAACCRVLRCHAFICDMTHSYWRTRGRGHRKIHVVYCSVLQCVAVCCRVLQWRDTFIWTDLRWMASENFM